jgi:nucleoside-diphosphate-sugar epimerase
VKRIAVAGARGFVGSHIAQAVTTSGRYGLIPVVRGESPEDKFAGADIVVHAANPAGRFQANQDPLRDFHETVEKTARLLAAAHGKRFVLISTLSCRTQLETSYGRHRRACELIALSAGALVIRLGAMFGGGRTRDSLHDILAGRPVFVSGETRYAYVDVAWVGRRVVDLLEAGGAGIREIGARNAIRLGDLRDRFASSSTFSGIDDTQIPEDAPDGPDANDVVAYAERELARVAEWR